MPRGTSAASPPTGHNHRAMRSWVRTSTWSSGAVPTMCKLPSPIRVITVISPAFTSVSYFLLLQEQLKGIIIIVMGRLVHTGLGSSSLVAHVLQYPPPTRKQLCTRSCSNKHTHTHNKQALNIHTHRETGRHPVLKPCVKVPGS